jgi:hypothetical protein
MSEAFTDPILEIAVEAILVLTNAQAPIVPVHALLENWPTWVSGGRCPRAILGKSHALRAPEHKPAQIGLFGLFRAY